MPDELGLSAEGHTVCHNALARLGCSAHAAAAIAAATQAAWFTLLHDDEVTAYAKGVLPGDPEADLLFTIVIKEALDEIHVLLVAAGLVEPLVAREASPAFAAHVPGDQPPPPPEVSFVDDSVYIIAAPATVLCSRAAAALGIIRNTFAKYGLPINFAPGKTEVLLGLHGKGSKAVRSEVYLEKAGRLRVPLAEGDEVVVITNSYKHLGSMISSDTHMTAEVSYRIKSLWAAVRPIARNFYKSDRFDPDVKALTLQPLLLSRLLFNAATWNPMSAADRRRLNGAFLRVLHLVTNTSKEDYADPLVHRKALVRAGIPALEDILRLQRLGFLPRLLKWAPPFVLQLVDAVPAFRAGVLDDLVWLGCQVPKLAGMPEPRHALCDWLDVSWHGLEGLLAHRQGYRRAGTAGGLGCGYGSDRRRGRRPGARAVRGSPRRGPVLLLRVRSRLSHGRGLADAREDQAWAAVRGRGCRSRHGVPSLHDGVPYC